MHKINPKHTIWTLTVSPFLFPATSLPPSSGLPPLLTFYCETGVDGLSSWNFYEYWSAGSSALWPALEEEWCTEEWKGKSGRRCSSGGGENQSGVLRGLGGCWGVRGGVGWDALMGSRLMEKDLRDLTSHTHSEKKKSEPSRLMLVIWTFTVFTV